MILFQRVGQKPGSFKNRSLKSLWWDFRVRTNCEEAIKERHAGAVQGYPQWGKLKRMTLECSAKCSKFRRRKLNSASWVFPACPWSCLPCLLRRHIHASVRVCPCSSPVPTAWSSQHSPCISTATHCGFAALPEVSGAVTGLLWIRLG